LIPLIKIYGYARVCNILLCIQQPLKFSRLIIARNPLECLKCVC